MGRIKSITFDLWDTVFIDDSDEPKRAATGLLSKPLERRQLVYNALKKHHNIKKEMVNAVYDTADAAFRHVWYGQNVTWTVRERLGVIFSGLKLEIPEPEMTQLVELHEEMELGVQPDLAPGIREALKSLKGRYTLGVISDAIFSPGRVLRQILSGYDLLKYFDVFVFSDEIGCSKPDLKMFEAVAEKLGVKTSEIAHIGDRDKKDIKGPQALGGKGIYTTVVNDRGSNSTTADAICTDYKDLPGIIEDLNRE